MEISKTKYIVLEDSDYCTFENEKLLKDYLRQLIHDDGDDILNYISVFEVKKTLKPSVKTTVTLTL